MSHEGVRACSKHSSAIYGGDGMNETDRHYAPHVVVVAPTET